MGASVDADPGRRSPSRRVHGPANVSGAIYGLLLVMTEVATLSEDPDTTSGELFAAVLGTVALFWVAHVYSEAAAEGLHTRPFRERLIEDRPIAQILGPVLLVLFVSAVGVYSKAVAVTIDLPLGVVTLFVWGLLIARRSKRTRGSALAIATVEALFGVGIVILKLYVH